VGNSKTNNKDLREARKNTLKELLLQRNELSPRVISILTRWYLSATVCLTIFPSRPFLFATRIPQRLIRREPRKPVKKASYERSKNEWRTCDLPMPQGTTRTQPASPSFLYLPPLSPPFSSVSSTNERFLAGLGPLPPFAACGSKPRGFMIRPDFTNGHTRAPFWSVASRVVVSLRWCHLTADKKLSLNSRRRST